MSDYQKLYSGISRVAWGYFFLYFDINLGTVSILPSFIGYLLFLSAISYLKDEERELPLLRTLGIILTLWNTAQWVIHWFAVDLNGLWQFSDILISLINLYFHFQLITNIASIAAKYQPPGYSLDLRLLRYRTLQTVMLTAVIILTLFRSWLSWISVITVIISLIAGICLMSALFKLRKCFR